METSENKDIRVFNFFKNIIAIVLATATVVSTVIIKSDGLQSQIQDVRKDQVTYGKLQEMNFKINDINSAGMQKQIDEIKQEITDLKKEIEDIENRLKR